MESTTPVMCTPARRKMSGPTGSSGGTSTCSKVTPNIYTPATRPVSLKKTPTSRFTGTDSFGESSSFSCDDSRIDRLSSPSLCDEQASATGCRRVCCFHSHPQHVELM